MFGEMRPEESPKETNKWTDGHNQMYYLPCFAIKNAVGYLDMYISYLSFPWYIYIRTLWIFNFYRFLQNIWGYIDYFLIRIKDLYGL